MFRYPHLRFDRLYGGLFLFKGYDMPWSLAQHKLFEAAAHSADVAKRVGIPMEQAQKMASEGVKKEPKAKRLAKALMK